MTFGWQRERWLSISRSTFLSICSIACSTLAHGENLLGKELHGMESHARETEWSDLRAPPEELYGHQPSCNQVTGCFGHPEVALTQVMNLRKKGAHSIR